MRIHSRRLFIIAILILIPVCVGCGGGGGAGSSPNDGGGGLPAPTLGLSVATPTVAGKVGQDVLIPITVTGSGTVTTAGVDVRVSEATFEPAVLPSDTAQEITDLPASATACYVWLNTQTIRVLFVSADGVPSGSVLVNVPVRVKGETSNTPILTNVAVNQ